MEKQPQGTSLVGLCPKSLCHEKLLSPSTYRLFSSNYPKSLFIGEMRLRRMGRESFIAR
jgi:hypothetical protein